MQYPFLLAVGSLGGYFISTNRNDDKRQATDDKLPSNPPMVQQPQPVNVYIPQQREDGNGWTLKQIFGAGCGVVVVALGVYNYYLSSRSTKIVTTRIDSAEDNIIDEMVKLDDNNAQRLKETENNVGTKIDDAALTIRSESRAGFDQLSAQMYILAQICMQAINKNKTPGDDDDPYADECQQKLDEVTTPHYFDDRAQQHKLTMAAEYRTRGGGQDSPTQGGAGEMTTPGGTAGDATTKSSSTHRIGAYRQISIKKTREFAEKNAIYIGMGLGMTVVASAGFLLKRRIAARNSAANRNNTPKPAALAIA